MIPFHTTTITVLQPTTAQSDGEAYESPPPAGYDVIATGVRAVIGSPVGTEIRRGAEQTDDLFTLNCDPTPMDHYSWIRDEITALEYAVTWCMHRDAFGLSFVQGRLKLVEGLV